MSETPAGFPLDPAEFDADDRISWSKADNHFILETEAGAEYNWDEKLKRWVAVLDEADLERQQDIYKVEGVEDDDETEQNGQSKKRKKVKQEANPKEKKPRVNTAVYVTSLPLDATIDEIASVFSRYGVIAEEIDTSNPRIKMYTSDDNTFKGDALIVYFRPESVQLAVQMLDDSAFRPGEQGPNGNMRVQVADFSYKKQTDVPDKGRPVGNKKEQKKVIKKTQKMNEKLADWSDDEIATLHGVSSRWDKVVILKHMFTIQEIEEDPAVMLEIKEDIRDECEKLGEVTNVQLFDKEIEGVASVRFVDATAARACVRVMNGRWFDNRQLVAYIADGSEKFKKNRKGKEDEDEGVEGDRLDQFGSWLEGGRTTERAKPL